jgi:uncharacterized membrane protein YdcZ (DUF606 family)
VGAAPAVSRKLVAATLATLVLSAAALGLLGAMFWTEEVLRRPPNPIIRGWLCAVLGVMMTGAAAFRYFVVTTRSRRPRWQRAYAILLLLWAASLFVLAFSGV